MTDKVKFHIPINTMEQVVIRDEIAKKFVKDFDAVVLHFTEHLIDIDNKIMLMPVSVMEVYVKKVTDELLDYFKAVAVLISHRIGDNVTLEVTRELIYTGTVEYKED